MQKAGSSLRFIAKKFKIDRSTVTNIVRNRTYKEVPV